MQILPVQVTNRKAHDVIQQLQQTLKLVSELQKLTRQLEVEVQMLTTQLTVMQQVQTQKLVSEMQILTTQVDETNSQGVILDS